MNAIMLYIAWQGVQQGLGRGYSWGYGGEHTFIHFYTIFLFFVKEVETTYINLSNYYPMELHLTPLTITATVFIVYLLHQ